MLNRSTKQLLPVALVIAVIASVLWWMLPQKEPQFAGLPASGYIRSILSSNFFDGTMVTNQLMPMGSAVAVAAITKVLIQEDTYWKHYYRSIHQKVPLWLHKRLQPRADNQHLIIRCGMALASFGTDAKPAVPTLAASYERGEEFTKMMLAGQFGRIGPAARAAIPSLLKVALQPGPAKGRDEARLAAIRTLAKVDPTGEASAAAIGKLLYNQDASLVTTTIDTLGIMAQQSPMLLPPLQEALWHWRLPVRVIAARHLGRLDALRREDVDPFLSRVVSDDLEGRVSAATVLGHAHAHAHVATAALVQALKDPNASVVQAAVQSLVLFAQNTNVARSIRITAAKAILERGSENQSWSTMDLLPRIVPEAAGTVPLLISALANASERTRGKAAITLGLLGSEAREAVPALKHRLSDEWFNVREAATNAITAIESRTP